MIRQIKKEVLPEKIRKAAAASDAVMYIRILPADRVRSKDLPGADQVTYVKCPAIRTDETSIFLALTKEKCPAGSLVTKAMWAGKPVAVLLTSGSEIFALSLYPDRLHISGGVFEEMLHGYRLKDATNDFAAVWEMSLAGAEQLTALPEGNFTEDVIDFYEMHYDNPALKA